MSPLRNHGPVTEDNFQTCALLKEIIFYLYHQAEGIVHLFKDKRPDHKADQAS